MAIRLLPRSLPPGIRPRPLLLFIPSPEPLLPPNGYQVPFKPGTSERRCPAAWHAGNSGNSGNAICSWDTVCLPGSTSVDKTVFVGLMDYNSNIYDRNIDKK